MHIIGDADYGSQVDAETITHKNGKSLKGKGLLPCKSVHECVNQSLNPPCYMYLILHCT